MAKLKPNYFYAIYFLLNLVNAYILTYGLIHPNISNYTFSWDSFLISLLGNLSITLLLYGISLILFPKTKARLNFLVICSFIFTILCVGLAVFSNIFSTFFKFSHLSCFNNPAQGNFFWFYAQYALNMLSDITQSIHLIPFVIILIFRFITDDTYINYYSPIYKSVIITFAILFLVLPIAVLNKKVKNTIYENSLNGLYGVNEIGLYSYYLYDFYQYQTNKGYNVTSTDVDLIKSFLSSKEGLSYLNPIANKTYTFENEFTGIAQDKNLIFIQLEAINNFVIDLVVDGEEIMPNLNKLKNQSLYYNRFYSTAGIGNTSDSEFSALTGLYGNGNDLTIFDYAGSKYETLAKDFKKAGYFTFSSHGNDGNFYHRNTEHINTLGFDAHYDIHDYGESVPLILSYLDDKYFFEHLVDFMPDEKFFAYGISVTSHSPFVPNDDIPQHHFSGLTRLASSYLDFCMYVDEAIGIFIGKLEEKDLLDDTIVVFFGDHTSSLFKPDLESIYKTTISEVDFRLQMQSVPLIIYNETLFTPQIKNKVTGTVDLYRSFANLYGLDPKYHLGNDIFTDELSFIYSPRNLDIIFDDFTYHYPHKKLFGNANPNLNQYIKLFENYKYVNDLILRTHHFR